jgi:hypothetical protein
MGEGEAVAVLRLPAREAQDVALQPRAELGGAADPARLAGRLSVVPPLLFPITADDVDATGPLRDFLRREAPTSAFYALDLVVNLRPGSGESFREVGVAVRLSCPQRPDPPPIAWSLSPMRETAPSAVQSTIGVTAKFGIVEPKVERMVDQPEQAYVTAYGLRESDCEWRFTATRQRDLAGPLQMQAVIKASGGTAVRADVVAAATVQLRGIPARRYRVALPPHLASASAG